MNMFGLMRSEGADGGVYTRGGVSKHNPDKLNTHFPWAGDNKNYIRGDTELRGDMNMFGTVYMARGDPGPMIERNYGNVDDRYGIGQFAGGATRVYGAGAYGPATVNLSIAKNNGAFDDVLTANTKGEVIINGDLDVKRNMYGRTICIGDAKDRVCLSKDELVAVKQLAASSRNAAVPVPVAPPIQPSPPRPPAPVVPAPRPPSVITSTSGLVGYYIAENFDVSRWTDISPSGNHAVSIRGKPVVQRARLNNRDIISFTQADGISFPATILPTTYTLFHVARYKPGGGISRRIFDGKYNNWLSGFWGGITGVAFHEGWVTPSASSFSTDWILSIDQNDMYIANNKNNTVNRNSAVHTHLSINDGRFEQERSDCDVACVIVYNRKLSHSEYMAIRSELNAVYGLNLSQTLS